YKSGKARGSGSVLFDTTAITPGTYFMILLDANLQEFFNDSAVFEELLAKRIVYSSHLVPGEGEHKIFDYYRTQPIPGKGKHVLYGMDADLIVLSLMSDLPGIILAKDSIPMKVTDVFGTDIDAQKKSRGRDDDLRNVDIDQLKQE